MRRAQEHRMQLGEYLDVALTDELVLRAERDRATGRHMFRISAAPDLARVREEVSLFVGDIVHNMRSALDHLYWDLACRHSGGTPPNPRSVQFPIERTEENYEESRFRDAVYAEHWDLIREFQPFKGRNGRPDRWTGPYIHQLRLLQYLSNRDKHRTLNIVLMVPNRVSFNVPFAVDGDVIKLPGGKDVVVATGGMVVGGSDLSAEAGTAVMSAQLAENAPDEVGNAGVATPHVSLEEGRGLTHSIDRVFDFVASILKAFDVPTGE